ncbi:MAG: UDP-N-acetylglucosamine--N-acetylmuramyl-(pentapeptide) pyrophosphoryl-undecaprenol N-acetylglucosamine transferase [Akkermansiaceae bacterium]|nr:UDP-N-acetylglucosamine--N-acetylmuramyl-(pentapeptide) pyrophosphoryl-undecaprenol N-acetylglucosamine transferase [Akkermansiaceae bacterium]
MSQPSLRVIIACGGTGGHLFPGIAVAQQLKAMGHRPLLLISRKEVDADGARKYGDLEFRVVQAVAKPPVLSLRMPGFLWKYARTLLTCRGIIRREQVDVVLGMGGFTSLAPVLAGRLQGLRTYVHESNAMPGRANRLTARFCTAVLLGMKEAAPRFPKSDCRVVGTPVREEFLHLPEPAAARAELSLPADKPLILVTGGSQGAQKLNTLMVETARSTPEAHFLIIAGRSDCERVQALAADLPNCSVMGFCSNMPAVYAAADGIITRSGASTLTELSVVAKPALLVPFPYAADNHQYINARVFADAGAAELCEQSALSVPTVQSFIRNTALKPAAADAMQTALRAQAKLHAAASIARVIAGAQ